MFLTTGRVVSADQILFSNLGPGGTYQSGSGGTFFGFTETQEDARFNFARAMPFVPNATALLTTVEVPITFPGFRHDWFDGGTLEVNVFGSTGGLPGPLLETFSSSGVHLPTSLSVFTSMLQPQLTAGLLYFLEVRAVGEANGTWNLTLGPSQSYVDYRRAGDGPWEVGARQFEAAFRISGEVEAAATPEPATLVLLGSGMAIAAWRRRRAS